MINVMLFLHLRQEQFIAYWDFGGFWRKSVEFNQMMDRSVKEAMDNLWFFFKLFRIFIFTRMVLISANAVIRKLLSAIYFSNV